jgi:hypothetical protein
VFIDGREVRRSARFSNEQFRHVREVAGLGTFELHLTHCSHVATEMLISSHLSVSVRSDIPRPCCLSSSQQRWYEVRHELWQ